MRTAAILTMLAAASLTAATAFANPTPTPTATAAGPVCTRTPPAVAPSCGSSRVRLNWSSKKPDVVTLSISATHCNAPAACVGATSGAVTTAPATVEISDSACNAFTATFANPALNTTGCPGGKDFYKGTTDKLRLIYGASTTALAFLRVPLAVPGAIPQLTPPLEFNIRDAAGYAIEVTLNTCLVTQTDTVYRLKCF